MYNIRANNLMYLNKRVLEILEKHYLITLDSQEFCLFNNQNIISTRKEVK